MLVPVVITFIDDGAERKIEIEGQDHLRDWLKKQGIQSLRRPDGVEVDSFKQLKQNVKYHRGPPVKPQQQNGKN